MLTAKTGMEGKHRALAEANENELRIIETVTFELGIKECIQYRLRLVQTGPLLSRIGIEHVQWKPLPPARGLGARLRRMRRDKSRVRQKILPLLGDSDQIIAIRPIAVQENDELFRRARFRRYARAIDHCRHLCSIGFEK